MSKRTIFLVLLISVTVFISDNLVKAEDCSSDSDCSGNYYGEVCCKGFCQNQFDYCSCNLNSDCPSDQYCCDYECGDEHNCGNLSGGAIAGIIIGIIFFIICTSIIILCVLGCFCAAGPFRNRARGRGYVQGPSGTTTVVATTTGMSNPGYPQYSTHTGQPGGYSMQPGQHSMQPGQYPLPAPQYGQNVPSAYQAPNQAPPPYPYVGVDPPASTVIMQK